MFPFAAAVARGLSVSLSPSRCQTPQTNTVAASQGRLHAWAASCSYPSKERVCTSRPARVTGDRLQPATPSIRPPIWNYKPLTPNLWAEPQLLKPKSQNLKLKTSNSEPPTPCLESQTPKPNVQTQTPRPLPFPLLAITTAQRGRLQVRRQRYDHAGGPLLEQDVHLAARIAMRFFYSRISEAILLFCSRRLARQSPQSLRCLRPTPCCSARVHV